MSLSEQEPCTKKFKMDPASEEISSILEQTDKTTEEPIEKFSILTAMMNTVPDILVDGVLSDLDFPDWFTFKCVSHRCQDIVLSNLNRLKKPEEIAVRILWANNTKTLVFGHQHDWTLRNEELEEKNTFIVLPSTFEQREVDPADSWREGSLLFTKKQTRYLNRYFGLIREVTEVCCIDGDEVDAVVLLLKKFLPGMLVNGIYARQLEKDDFVMLSEVLKTHAIPGNIHVKIDCSMYPTSDLMAYTFETFKTDRSVQRYLSVDDIMSILVKERLASISLRHILTDVAIPKNFFESHLLKNIVKISLNSSTEDDDSLAAEFDDELLLTTLPQLKELQIGKSNVTTAGLNTLLKQYIAVFSSLSLILHHPNESITRNELWKELVNGISWLNYNQPLIAYSEAGYKERNLGMSFLGTVSNCGVEFFTIKSDSWIEVIEDV